MARAGRSMVEVQRELGHSNATMTSTYLHLFADDREAKTSAYDAKIRGDIEAADAFLMHETPGKVIALPGS